MESTRTSAARREFVLVLALATCGLAVALLVAFAPWYDPVTAGSVGTSVVQTYLPDGLSTAVARAS